MIRSGSSDTPARVAVVGPGRVGTTLAAAAIRAGYRVAAVAGGSEASRVAFARHFAGVRTHDDPAAAAAGAGLVLVTTPDDVIDDVVTAIAIADGFVEGQRVVHTSGAQGVEPLRRAALAGARVAACHPAQTFASREPDPDAIVGAAWAVTADRDDRGWAHELVTQFGGTPHDVPGDRRSLYHAGLVVASNAVGAAVAVARQLLVGARVEDPLPFLAPLVDASVANVLERGAEALTGPVVRGDVGTVERQLERLRADAPHLAAAYRDLTATILRQVRPALDPDVTARFDELLEEDRWND
ncbi:MAG: Rossmann-like and DUF2520 domain-containing protein [Nitriliruptorales bacterium]|nr:Rossmann-like and DUF2520 domain-containing protein [Nitriliruptorales bacterium]